MVGSELKAGARNLIRDNSPKIFIFSIIYVILATVMGELQLRLPGFADAFTRYIDELSIGKLPSLATIVTYLRPTGAPFAVVLWLLLAVLDTGVKSYCLKILRGTPGDYKDLFDGFLFLGKVLLIRSITVIFIALWSLLLFFPGIMAAYRYRLAYYILIDDPRKGAFQCIRESKRLMHKRKLDLFLVDLSFIGWIFLDACIALVWPFPFTLPLVPILLTPYHGLTCATFYDRILKELAA